MARESSSMLPSWRVKAKLVLAHWLLSLKLTRWKRSSSSTMVSSVCFRFLLTRMTVALAVMVWPSSRQSLKGFSPPEFPLLSVKPVRPSLLSRRSIIATAAGLAATAGWGKFCAAQTEDMDLPDAAAALTMQTPGAAPPLVFTNLKGKQRTLAHYADHTLVINLWATWCGPCVAELPTFDALAPKLKSIGALILPVSIDLAGADAVLPFYKSHGIKNLPILLDPNGDNMNLLNTDGIPVTVIINPAGQLVARLDGAANWDTPAVMQLLRGQSTTPPAAKPKAFIPV